MEKKRYSILFSGGVGKAITATTFVRWLNQKEPDAELTIVSPWPEVFMQNRRVHRNLHINTSYIFDDYLNGTDFRNGEPYSWSDYFTRSKHISELWPKALGFEGYNDNIEPELFFSDMELNAAKQGIAQIKPPIVTVQFQGGNQPMPGGAKPNKQRNLEFQYGQLVVNALNNAGFSVIQIRLPQETELKGVYSFNVPFRNQLCLLPYTAGHVGIDSSFMHAAAATKKPALIFWQATNVNNLGYPWMKNVINTKCPTPMCGRPHLGHLNDIVPGSPWTCPYNMACNSWDEALIIKSIDEFIEELKKNGTPTQEEVTSESKTRPEGHEGLPVQGPPACPSCPATRQPRLKKSV